MKQSALAAVLKRDLLRTDNSKPSAIITECFSCGFGIRYRGSRFCSERCREWFDAGRLPYSAPRIGYCWRDGRLMKMGSRGFPIDCAHCGKEFDSKGLRCCTIECERRYRERQDNLAVMAQAGIEAAPKRQCANTECGQTVPKWRKGRKVSGATRFCSRRCAEAARKGRAAA